jgi:hypothetical protein
MEKYQEHLADWLDYVQEFTLILFMDNFKYKDQLRLTEFECFTLARNLATDFQEVDTRDSNIDFTERCKAYLEHELEGLQLKPSNKIIE